MPLLFRALSLYIQILVSLDLINIAGLTLINPTDPNPSQSFAGMQWVYPETVEINDIDTKKKNTQDK